MKSICSVALALGLVASTILPAGAARGTPVSGVVETPHAVFFQPSQFPTVVWFFPRSEVDLALVPPMQPSGNFWRAAVVFQQVTAEDLALLPPEWTGKSFVPFIIRPDTECALTRLAEMRFVFEEVSCLERDVGPANPPACRFSFRLPMMLSPDLQARLDALVSSDTLVVRQLELELEIEATVAWAEVHAAVAAVLAESPPPGRVPPALTPDEARAALERALASPALGVVSAAMTAAEQETFIQAALATLFSTSTTGSTNLLRFVTPAPAGSVVYHLEPFQRAM
jgi:hypothetical protein